MVSVMTGGDRCQQLRKMMCRGPDGGCATEERPCQQIVPKIPPKVPDDEEITEKPPSLDIDSFSQARKALAERCPFDIPEDGDVNLSVATLPTGLANLLRPTDSSRKRHRKSNSGADKKGKNIWVDTEEYFRDLALPDIDILFEVSNLADKKCFLIPFSKNNGDESGVNARNESNGMCCGCENGGVNVGDGDGDADADANANANGVVEKQEVKEENMEIDSVGVDSLGQEEKGSGGSVSDEVNGLEWILGSRTRALLTSERPSKKRKLLGSDAGLEKVLIGCPCDGVSSLCHYCCKGELGEESNRLIVCSYCKVAVHQKCYGVEESVDGSWLCSWCKEKSDSGDSVEQPCVFCPKQGGALKPVHKSDENGGSVEFAHLFCSLLMPEVYVEDLTKMEPIMNVEGIKETRRKLICNICKVKCGACVRCSHGTCRTSFHPICAREARHRVEVWGKYGCDNIELRAFCSKHSEVQDNSGAPHLGDTCVAVDGDSSVANNIPVALSMNKSHKIGHRNGDKINVLIESTDTNSDKSGESELQEMGLLDSGLNARLMSDCGDGQQLDNVRMLERSNSEDVNPSDFLKFAPILKKLIDRGKVNVKDVALEIGVSPNSFTATLADGSLAPHLQCKIVKWFRNHAFMGTSRKNLTAKIKSAVSSHAEIEAADCSDGVTVSDSDISDPVAVKSVPPRRRTKSSIRILRDKKAKCSSEEIFSDNGIVMDEVKVDQLVRGESDNSSKASIPDATEKNSTKPEGFQDCLARNSLKSEGSTAKPLTFSLSERGQLEEADVPQQNTSVNTDQGYSESPSVNPILPDLIKTEAFPGFYIHPYIHKNLLQMQSGVLLKNRTYEFEGKNKRKHEFDGTMEGETSRLEASSSASVCCDHQSHRAKCKDMICKYGGVNLEQLEKARNMGVLELSAQDEVEGEIIYFQHRLLSNAVARKQLTDNLVCKVSQSLPQEIDAARRQRWDAVLANQYLCEVREAKKQGRKERRRKEAQAVLAAATAAAAASSRISSFRKDPFEESPHQENLLKSNTSNGRAGISSQLMPRPKDTISRMAVPRVSSEKYSDFVQSVSDFSKEHPRSCDICRRSETILNPILVCSSCKVAVHLDCYRSVKESPGPWYCELCEELLSSRSTGAPSVNFWEKPYFVAECGLCGGTTGAFRKSSDGQWVHAFCAEWVFESTFRRGQVNPVEGMDTSSKGVDVCLICRRKHGICIKCYYGHCQTTFHPSCARSAGFYMNVKANAGKLQHKAYCEKHSLEQRAKAETQKHGIEDLKSIKQVRVELERLRLLCERIIKREKIKRDLVLCSQDMLGCNRDHVARSVLARSSIFPADVSSESATTSLKGHSDGCKSCSEAIQRSDDVTVDSTVSVKHRIKVPVTMDTDQKTDDSSTSQNLFTPKPTERLPFSGKQIPQRPSLASRNLSDDGEWSSKSRKHIETFEKELVMTSDQASMKNQRLPRGYAYVPKDCLSKEKQINQDACSGEPMEHDG